MKFLSSFAVLALVSIFVEASGPDGFHRMARHNKIARRGSVDGRCKVRPSTSQANPPSNTESTNGSSSSNNDTGSGNVPNTLINVSSQCGPSGATKEITATSGPNGCLDWLNCGLNGDGWNPPFITVNDIVIANLDSAAQQPDSPFQACKDFIWAFNQYGNQYSVPPIILASFAMQESSCNPNAVGGAGEQGLMQLTKDKCGNAPGGNCLDVAYNVETGAKYFSNSLAANGGNLLLTIGAYNGWSQGLTVGSATAIRWSCCRCQQNLDYLHQFMNGWIQNVNAYDHTLGAYFNLNVC